MCRSKGYAAARITSKTSWLDDLSSAEGHGKHDSAINILDIVRLTPPTFNTSCTP